MFKQLQGWMKGGYVSNPLNKEEKEEGDKSDSALNKPFDS